MRGFGCRIALLLLLNIADMSPAQQPLFHSGVDAVTIHASITRKNRAVVGLTADDLELLDNGVAQRIQVMSVEALPIDVTVVLDVSSSVDGPTLQRLKRAIEDTVGLLRAEDRIRLVAITQVVREVLPLRHPPAGLPLDGLLGEGATSLYDGLAATMMQPSAVGRRHLVMVFTDGRDSTSIIDIQTAKSIAHITDAVVDIVMPMQQQAEEPASRSSQGNSVEALQGLGNVVVGQQPLRNNAAGVDHVSEMRNLVEPTAGEVFTIRPRDSLSERFRAMLSDFRSSYILQFSPNDVSSVGWHDVIVRVKKQGSYDVRARKGYRRDGAPLAMPSERGL